MWSSSQKFEVALLSLLALLFLVHLSMALMRMHGNDTAVLRRRRGASWLTSSLFCTSLSVAFLFLGAMTALKSYRYLQSRKHFAKPKALLLVISIPRVSPERTYTVVAKFRVHGHAHTSVPLRIRFGAQKKSYQLTLYYDDRDPSINSWTKFKTADRRELKEALAYGIGFVLIGIFLLHWAEIGLIRRSLVHRSA